MVFGKGLLQLEIQWKLYSHLEETIISYTMIQNHLDLKGYVFHHCSNCPIADNGRLGPACQSHQPDCYEKIMIIFIELLIQIMIIFIELLINND